MKNRLFATILCLIISLTLISCGSSSKIYTLDDVDASVFTLHYYDEKGNEYCTGSGFTFFDSTTIITNYHVVNGIASIEVASENGDIYHVSDVIAYSDVKDLAILKLEENANLSPLTLGDSTLWVSEISG